MNKTNLIIVWRSVASLHPYKGNARQHSKAQIKKLKASLKKYGWGNPIIIDENGMVLCGAGRLQAAIELGMTDVPTIALSHMTEADKRAFIIADNRIATQASWSKSLLRDELRGLVELGYEVELTGFDTLEIDTLLSFEGAAPIDDDVHLPGPRAAVVSQLGDLWTCGKHRLLLGDARDASALEILMDGSRAQLIFTDPPYGCAIAGNVSGLGKVKHEDFVMGAGETSLPEFGQTILRAAFRQLARHASARLCTCGERSITRVRCSKATSPKPATRRRRSGS